MGFLVLDDSCRGAGRSLALRSASGLPGAAAGALRLVVGATVTPPSRPRLRLWPALPQGRCPGRPAAIRV